MSEHKKSAAGLKKIARSTVSGTKRIARIAKLNLGISDEKKNITRLYTEIGRLYYEAHQDDPEGFFVQLFQQVDSSMEAVAAMQDELTSLKAEAKPDADEDDITVEIEAEPEETVQTEDDTGIEVEITAEPDQPAGDTAEQS